MNKFFSLVAVAMLAAVGCGQPAVGPAESGAELSAVSLELCGKCGQVAGGEACCAEGAESCSKCSLAKGSPGCCKVEATDGKIALCADCGQVNGSESCCSADGEKCACGWHKGSPACCKITKPGMEDVAAGPGEGSDKKKDSEKKTEEAA